MSEAERDEVFKMRSKFMSSSNNRKYNVVTQILWVSATVFAVIVIAGRAEFGALFLVSVVLNALCILACSVSIYKPVDSADRSNVILARLMSGKLKHCVGRLGDDQILRASHRKMTVFVRRIGGKSDILLHESKRKIFEICEVVAYVCFVLMVICLTVFALAR